MNAEAKQPSPELFFDTLIAYQRTAAIRAAVELEIFTAIAEGNTRASEIAERCGAAERGARILCDYLTLNGFLTKQDGHYGLTQESALFLNKQSPAYVGAAVEFLTSPMVTEGFDLLTDAVRKGGAAKGEAATTTPENPVWVKFARGMAPLMQPAAQAIAEMVDAQADQPLKVLDIAAGHGAFGIAFAKRNSAARIYAVDWAPVLEVAGENAVAAGVADRHHKISGSAFEVDFGNDYDIVLITNFLHHFDVQTNESLLKKVKAALKKGGRAVALEFIPNDDRVTPPNAAAFSLTMLAGTPGGDAYTFREIERMFADAGFSKSEMRELPPLQRVVISVA